ncbi:hypothetical protein NKR19_g9473, partial [Coniochaeta hoffmannii]
MDDREDPDHSLDQALAAVRRALSDISSGRQAIESWHRVIHEYCRRPTSSPPDFPAWVLSNLDEDTVLACLRYDFGEEHLRDVYKSKRRDHACAVIAEWTGLRSPELLALWFGADDVRTPTGKTLLAVKKGLCEESVGEDEGDAEEEGSEESGDEEAVEQEEEEEEQREEDEQYDVGGERRGANLAVFDDACRVALQAWIDRYGKDITGSSQASVKARKAAIFASPSTTSCLEGHAGRRARLLQRDFLSLQHRPSIAGKRARARGKKAAQDAVLTDDEDRLAVDERHEAMLGDIQGGEALVGPVEAQAPSPGTIVVAASQAAATQFEQPQPKPSHALLAEGVIAEEEPIMEPQITGAAASSSSSSSSSSSRPTQVKPGDKSDTQQPAAKPVPAFQNPFRTPGSAQSAFTATTTARRGTNIFSPTEGDTTLDTTLGMSPALPFVRHKRSRSADVLIPLDSPLIKKAKAAAGTTDDQPAPVIEDDDDDDDDIDDFNMPEGQSRPDDLKTVMISKLSSDTAWLGGETVDHLVELAAWSVDTCTTISGISLQNSRLGASFAQRFVDPNGEPRPRVIVVFSQCNNHWVTVCLDTSAWAATVWDSLVRAPSPATKEALASSLARVGDFLPVHGREKPSIAYAPGAPKQDDAHNCGVFAVVVGWYLAAGLAPPKTLNGHLWRRLFLAAAKQSSLAATLPRQLVDVDVR